MSINCIISIPTIESTPYGLEITIDDKLYNATSHLTVVTTQRNLKWIANKTLAMTTLY